MPEKKNQHLVPACYLNHFKAEIPAEYLSNPHFGSCIYVNNRTLEDGWKLRGFRHSVFTKSYYYNLASDDPKSPVVENYLSQVEGIYSQCVQELLLGEATIENLSFISYFTALQHMRVEKFMEEHQSTWNKIAETMDAFEGGEKYRNEAKDLVKKQLMFTDLRGVLLPHARIAYNSTRIPLLTSDTPVIRRQVNIIDMKAILPGPLLKTTLRESDESFLVYFPISPSAAFISSPIIRDDAPIKIEMTHQEQVISLNIHMIVNSRSRVYSSVPKPFIDEKGLSEYVNSANCRHMAKIYTFNKRIIGEARLEANGNEELSLIFSHGECLIGLNAGDDISLVEIIEDGESVRGMRDCVVKEIDPDRGFICIESSIKFGI